MKNTLELKNTKAGGVCLIIGGGGSVNDIDWNRVAGKAYVVAVNYYFLQRPYVDAYCHSDREVGQWYDSVCVDCDVWSYAPSVCKRTTHEFNVHDYAAGSHTPFYALQIADSMGFDEIYLIGLDYSGDPSAIHYYDTTGAWVQYADTELYLKYLEHKCSISAGDKIYFELQKQRYEQRFFAERNKKDDVLDDFDRVEWQTEIYNANANSRLKKFPHRLPYC